MELFIYRDFGELISLIEHSLKCFCSENINAVLASFQSLDRSKIDPGELVEMKYTMQHWRREVARRALDELHNKKLDYVACLANLGLYLPESYLHQLLQISNARDIAHLIALQGNHTMLQQTSFYREFASLAGPKSRLSFRATKENTRWPYEKWSKNTDFCQYQYCEDGVYYRGYFFRPGDVVLTNVNLDGNGPFTALSEPRNYATHCGFIAILQEKLGKFPVVVETYERGVRAIPLSLFISPNFNSYAEVYRLKGITASQTEKINQAAPQVIREVWGYNFDTLDTDRRYLSCTTVGSVLFEAAGIEAIRAASVFSDAQIAQNCDTLGFYCRHYLSPIDYMRDERMEFVAAIDNNHFEKSVVREISDRCFKQLFSTKKVQLNRFPISFKLTVWGIEQIRKQTILGRIFGGVKRFNPRNLPKGEANLLAVIELLYSKLGRAERVIYKKLAKSLEQEPSGPFIVTNWAQQRQIQEIFRQAYRQAASWFV